MPNRSRMTRHGPSSFLCSCYVSSRAAFADHTQSSSPSCAYCNSPSPSHSGAYSAAGVTNSNHAPVHLPHSTLFRIYKQCSRACSGTASTVAAFNWPRWFPGIPSRTSLEELKRGLDKTTGSGSIGTVEGGTLTRRSRRPRKIRSIMVA